MRTKLFSLIKSLPVDTLESLLCERLSEWSNAVFGLRCQAFRVGGHSRPSILASVRTRTWQGEFWRGVSQSRAHNVCSLLLLRFRWLEYASSFGRLLFDTAPPLSLSALLLAFCLSWISSDKTDSMLSATFRRSSCLKAVSRTGLYLYSMRPAFTASSWPSDS